MATATGAFGWMADAGAGVPPKGTRVGLAFIVSVILAVLGILGYFAVIPVVTPNAYWLLLAGYVVLAIGVLFKGK